LNGGINTPEYSLAAFAGAPAGFSGTPPTQVSAVAETYAVSNDATVVSASAKAGETNQYLGGGSGQGIISFDVQFSYAHFDVYGADEVILSDGVHTYDFVGGGGIHGPIAPKNCFIESCEYVGVLPFDLGANFTATANSFSEAGGGRQGHDASASASFTLLAADGITPVGFGLAGVPEPSTVGLYVFGLVATTLCCGVSRRYRPAAGNANATSASPAPTATYCLPSSS
jgi:hypothetical protein